MRIEKDGMGEMALPEESYYGCGAERHRIAFPVGPFELDDYPLYIRAVALLKLHAPGPTLKSVPLTRKRRNLLKKRLGKLPTENLLGISK